MCWALIYRILGQEGSYPRIFGTFYKSVVQETLLFRTEPWVTTTRIGRTHGGFYHMVALQLEGLRPRRDTAGRWF